MIAKREVWNYSQKTDVWIGKYRNSHNLPHWHSDCELICVEQGELEVVCENKKYLLNKNDGFFIDSEQVHYMQAKVNDTLLQVIIFNFDVIKNLFNSSALDCPKLVGYDVCKLYNELKSELSQKLPYYNDYAKAKITEFFVNVLRREKTVPRKEKSTGRLKMLIDKINSEFDTLTFDDAYRFMAMDESYFCRYFKKATGMPFTQYLNLIRIDNAVRLMRQEHSPQITEIAIAVGFGSIRHFNKTFKDVTGYAPTALPKDFVLTEYAFHTDNEFNPTLQECTLVEGF